MDDLETMDRARLVSIIAGALVIAVITGVFLFIVARLRSRGAALKAEIAAHDTAAPGAPGILTGDVDASGNDVLAPPGKHILDTDDRRANEALKRDNDEMIVIVVIAAVIVIVMLVVVVVLINSGESTRQRGLDVVGRSLETWGISRRSPAAVSAASYYAAGRGGAANAAVQANANGSNNDYDYGRSIRPGAAAAGVNSSTQANDEAFRGGPPRAPGVNSDTQANEAWASSGGGSGGPARAQGVAQGVQASNAGVGVGVGSNAANAALGASSSGGFVDALSSPVAYDMPVTPPPPPPAPPPPPVVPPPPVPMSELDKHIADMNALFAQKRSVGFNKESRERKVLSEVAKKEAEFYAGNNRMKYLGNGRGGFNREKATSVVRKELGLPTNQNMDARSRRFVKGLDYLADVSQPMSWADASASAERRRADAAMRAQSPETRKMTGIWNRLGAR